jgi:maltooligosyltrehalose synthase
MEGPHAAHVLGFARRLGNEAALCVVPRLTLQLPRTASGAIAWEGVVRVPDGLAHPLVDLITGARFEPGEAVPLEQLLGSFPVALLRSTEGTEERVPAAPTSYAV